MEENGCWNGRGEDYLERCVVFEFGMVTLFLRPALNTVNCILLLLLSFGLLCGEIVNLV